MSDISGVAPGGVAEVAAVVAPAPVVTPVTVVEPAPVSPRDAGRALAARRIEKQKERETQTAVETPPTEIKEPDAQPAVADPVVSDQQQPDPSTPTPIEPPRSWTKEAKERWQSLPPETQEYLATREQERDREVRRSQNEAAEQRKTFDVERQAVTQARQQYEAALPALMNTLQSQQAGEFSDIKSIADVERLAAEDWPRYAKWDAAQKKLAAVQSEVTAAQQRQQAEYQTQWTDFAKKQDQLFTDRAPEFSDKAKATKLGEAAVGLLKDIGFDDKELAALWNGQSSVSIRDHRVQLLILDGVRYRDAQKSAKIAAAKPVPPVQRPGVAQPRGAAAEASLQALKTKAETSGSIKDAAQLIAARRRAEARR